MLLGICLISLGTENVNIGYESVPVNKFVEGKYQEDYKIESTDIKEYKNTVKEDTAKEDTKVSSTSSTVNEKQTVSETQVEAKEVKTTSTKSKENKNPIGKPIKAELTAYCNDPRCTGGKSQSKTAMQTKTRLGVIAAPSNIPLGSKIYIPGLENYKADGMFDVEDRGGAIKIKKDGTYIIDVWVPTYEEAIKFGRKNVTIYLVE